MRIRGVCLRTVDEQRAGGDESPIDPKTIEIPSYVQIRLGFSGDSIGGGIVQLHEGRLWLESGELDVDEILDGSLAIGFLFSPSKVVLTEVSVTDNPSDTGTPPYERLS